MTDPKTTSDTLRKLVLMLRAAQRNQKDLKKNVQNTLEVMPVYSEYLGRVEQYRVEKKTAEKFVDIALSLQDPTKLHEAVSDEHQIDTAHDADRHEVKEWLAALPVWIEYVIARKHIKRKLDILNNSIALCVELGPDQIEMPFVGDPEITDHLDEIELDLDNP